VNNWLFENRKLERRSIMSTTDCLLNVHTCLLIAHSLTDRPPGDVSACHSLFHLIRHRRSVERGRGRGREPSLSPNPRQGYESSPVPPGRSSVHSRQTLLAMREPRRHQVSSTTALRRGELATLLGANLQSRSTLAPRRRCRQQSQTKMGKMRRKCQLPPPLMLLLCSTLPPSFDVGTGCREEERAERQQRTTG